MHAVREARCGDGDRQYLERGEQDEIGVAQDDDGADAVDHLVL